MSSLRQPNLGTVDAKKFVLNFILVQQLCFSLNNTRAGCQMPQNLPHEKNFTFQNF
jgi:hypothetical protein